jgi:hypothetical protein
MEYGDQDKREAVFDIVSGNRNTTINRPEFCT